MDTLFWKKQHNNIEFQHPTKQYFRKYLYKLEVFAPGCKSIHAERHDILSSIEIRKQLNRGYNYGGSWHNDRMYKWLESADIEFLELIKQLKSKHTNLKFRTEEPKIQIYGSSEHEIKQFVSDIPTQFKHYISKFSAPENTKHEQLLSNNKILVKSKPKFQYKVFLREKSFNELSRQKVNDYLESLEDLVYVTERTKYHLTRQPNWMWSCLFYTNDPGVVEFVRLIEPDIVREVCELVYIGE
jgi:hypothetical protein